MGILAADAIIKTAIELSLDDMRSNDWLLDDVFSDFTKNPYLKQRYGEKQVKAAKEWFQNNKITLSLGYISDRMEPPHVTIVLGPQNEKPEMKTLGDASTETIKLLPNQIKKPIPFIVKPFTPKSYDAATGIVGVDPNLPGLDSLESGMILVNPSTGEGFVIQDYSDNEIIVESGLSIDATQLAVVPADQYYIARVEHSFSQASYQVICVAHGDPQACIWLHDLVLYGLYRYREALLEANGMAETVFQSTPLLPDSNTTNDGGDLVWNRTINISSQIEQSWIKTPQRVIEKVSLRENTKNGYIGGISVLTNLDAESFTESNWYTDTIETADKDFAEE